VFCNKTAIIQHLEKNAVKYLDVAN